MMLCKLSFKNIRKSFKDYAIYFFTLILGVSIFYVFNAIESQTVMMNMTSSSKSIIELITNMMSGVSVFVSCILGFLVIYASRFLIKRRKKEFGIYLTLGMSKQKISLILFLETLMIGVLSLLVGLFLGVFLSQWMSILVIHLFEADMTKFQFVFSFRACMKTFAYFGIIYFLVMVFNTFNISKCKLIDLLNSSKKSEKITMKNPFFCVVVFFFSACILGYAYYMVTVGAEVMLDTVDKIFLPIGMGLVSTYGIIWSLSGLILKLVQKTKKIYYKGLNSFTLRQISSKINTTVFSMSVICIMLFVTICVLSSALSIKNSVTHNLKTLAPMDIEFTKELHLEEDYVKKHYRYTKEMIADSNLTLDETLSRFGFNKKELKDVVEYAVYESNEVLLKDTLGDYYQTVASKFPSVDFTLKEAILSVTDYNRVADVFHLEPLELSYEEYAVVANYNSILSIRNEALKEKTVLQINGVSLHSKYDTCQNGFLEMSSSPANMGIIVVSDEIVQNLKQVKAGLLGNYKGETKEEKKEYENKMIELFETNDYLKYTDLDVSTKFSIYESSNGLGALVTFIGLYLGIIFLISSAAILALKELSESSDNKSRFTILRKLGAEEKTIEKALFRQIGIFFLFPLILAIIHSIFGIKFCTYILEVFGEDQLFPSIMLTAIFLVLIYGGYFMITYKCSKRIIKE